jgi:hypothetical protein
MVIARSPRGIIKSRQSPVFVKYCANGIFGRYFARDIASGGKGTQFQWPGRAWSGLGYSNSKTVSRASCCFAFGAPYPMREQQKKTA